MEKSFKQQESNSVLGSDGVDDVERPVPSKTGDKEREHLQSRTRRMLAGISTAALALAMGFGFGVTVGEVADASVTGHAVAPGVVRKSGSCGSLKSPQVLQHAWMVSDTHKLVSFPQMGRQGGWS